MEEKDNCKQLHRKSRNQLVCRTCICLFLFVLLIVTSYFSIGYLRSVVNTQHDVSQRIHKLEIEHREAYDIILNVVAAVKNVTGALQGFENYFIPRRLVKDSRLQLQPPRGRERRRRNEDSNEQQDGEGESEEGLQRSIHSFQTQMSTLNDRLRLLIRYAEKDATVRGVPGLPGKTGKVGPPGLPGVNGRDGYHGSRGERGLQGPPGPEGPQGPSGSDGLNGVNGIPGLPGYKGNKGERGHIGASGINGVDGSQGPMGRTGSSGNTGSPGLKGEKGECITNDSESLKNEEINEKKEDQSKSHVVYTMWGSSKCSTTSKIIYTGHAGTSKYETDDGRYAGSNLVCMPISSKRYRRQTLERTAVYEEGPPPVSDPQLVPSTIDTPTINATEVIELYNITEKELLENVTIIYNTTEVLNSTYEPRQETTATTEMPLETRFVPKYAKLVGTRKYVACSVCDLAEKSAKLMIPATTECPNSWSVEYQGYLMNYHHGTENANLICVNDQAFGVSPSSDDGIREILSKYLSHVKTDCNTFPCPPLSHTELLKCVVCSI